MDDVRVYRIAFYFEDGSKKLFDGEDAYWGTLQGLIAMVRIAVDGYNRNFKRVTKWEVEEID